MACCASADCGAGRVRWKLVAAFPCRWISFLSICSASMGRVQPCSLHASAYQSRAAVSLSFSSGVTFVAPGQLCNDSLHNFSVGIGLGEGPHVLQSCGRMVPCKSRNSRRRSLDSRSTTLAPQPSRLCRARIDRRCPSWDDEPAVHRQYGLNLRRRANADLQLVEQRCVVKQRHRNRRSMLDRRCLSLWRGRLFFRCWGFRGVGMALTTSSSASLCPVFRLSSTMAGHDVTSSL